MCGLEYQGISLIKTRHLQYISAFQFVNPQVATFAHLSRRQLPKFLRGRLHLHKCGLPAIGEGIAMCTLKREEYHFWQPSSQELHKGCCGNKEHKEAQIELLPSDFYANCTTCTTPLRWNLVYLWFPHLNMLNYPPLELHRPLGRCTGVYSYS